MRKKAFLNGLGTLGTLLALLPLLSGCPQPDNEAGSGIVITGITAENPFKVYVRLKNADTVVATGDAKVSNGAATVKIKVDEGTYTMDVIVTPQRADSYEVILAYGKEGVAVNGKSTSFSTGDLTPKNQQERESLYNEVVSADDEIGTPAHPNTSKIEISNIPPTIGDKASYKIYVQLSSGMTASAGYIAKGEAKIEGRLSLVIETLYDPEGNVWSGKGSNNIAITICPQNVSSYNDIQVHATMPTLAKETEGFDWEKMIDLWKMPGMSSNIEALYEGIVKVDPDITKN